MSEESWYSKNRESVLKKKKEFRENNKEYLRQYKIDNYNKHKDKISESRKEKRLLNRDAINEKASLTRVYTEKMKDYNKEYSSRPIVQYSTRKSYIERTYNILIDSIYNMMDEQKGCCKICNKSLVTPDSPRNYHIDHCHTTDNIRGLLCHKCNLALGLIDEDKEILKSMMLYID